MEDVFRLLAEHELRLYGLLGAVALICLALALLAARRLGRTPFGLEQALARRSLNNALTGLLLSLALGASLHLANHYVAPAWFAEPTELPSELRPTVAPTPTLILSAGPLTVDSSGCDPERVMLTQPSGGARLTGEVEVLGTANVPNLAFYRVEISGVTTNGAWVTLDVGNEPKVNGRLGNFNVNSYPAGEYAFRLVVTDNLGRSYPACTIAVTFAPLSSAPLPTLAP
ncbi:MAG: hypothetical protein NZM11_05105 [Anaerolineales bacterium]|nr:hypothetical protein [Anaerolineales bacterium]